MVDLTPLTNWLQSLGTVGYLLAAALPVVLYLLRQKLGPIAPPVTPTPDPTPANNPPRLDAIAPMLDALLKSLGIAPKGRAATVADLPHSLHIQLGNEWDKVNDAKSAAVTQMAKDLVVSPADPPAAK